MKAIVIKTVIIFSALLGYYTNQKPVYKTPDFSNTGKINSVDKLNLSYFKKYKIDIGQADGSN